MTKNDYLNILVEQIHSVVVATVGSDGLPQTRVIDMMLQDSDGVYFLKAFYSQLEEQKFVAISAAKGKIAVSLRGKVKNIGRKNLDLIFEKNPYMKEIYPGETRAALEVFQITRLRANISTSAFHPKSSGIPFKSARKKFSQPDISFPPPARSAKNAPPSARKTASIFPPPRQP